MSHITEFVVEGLAGRLEPLSLKLARHVNVFFGLNGSGKTSLLKILHSAMSGDGAILANVPFTRATVSVYSIEYDKVFTRSCARGTAGAEFPTSGSRQSPLSMQGHDSVDAERRGEPDVEWTESPDVGRSRSGWRHSYLPTARLYLSDRVRLPTEAQFAGFPYSLSEEVLEEWFADLVNRRWSSYSARVLGDIQRAQAEGLTDILRAVLGGARARNRGAELDSQAAYSSVTKFLERQGAKSVLGDKSGFARHYRKDPQLRSVVRDINEVEAKIQKATSPRDELQSVIQRMFSGKKKVTFSADSIEVNAASGGRIGLARLSSGEKHLIRILIDTLLADESSVILDEPEISMHVDWQKCLIGTMRQLSPEAQLIVATHSPEIMQDVKDENIHRL